jgi:predicted nucleic acid-binding protein
VTGAFVADASVAIAWVHPGQASADTAGMLDDLEQGAAMIVPALWPLEVANALLVLTRRGKLTAAERDTALLALGTLPVTLDHDGAGVAWTTLSQLAERHQLSVYDAAYLELAARRRLPLACRDGALKTAAKAMRLKLWTRG